VLEGVVMSRHQFGFLIGFAVAVLWALAGFLVTLGAVVGGLIGFAAVRLLDGELNVREAVDRLSARR